jgi:hypothetical protein
MVFSRDIRRIRDQVTNYLSSIFAAGHVAEAVSFGSSDGGSGSGGGSGVLRSEFIWALVFERGLSDAVNHKYRLLLVRKDHLLALPTPQASATKTTASSLSSPAAASREASTSSAGASPGNGAMRRQRTSSFASKRLETLHYLRRLVIQVRCNGTNHRPW